jgi:hypothetical protein
VLSANSTTAPKAFRIMFEALEVFAFASILLALSYLALSHSGSNGKHPFAPGSERKAEAQLACPHIATDLKGDCAVVDVGDCRTGLKLIVSSQPDYKHGADRVDEAIDGWRSRIRLILAKPGRDVVTIWQSANEDLYQPGITVLPEFNYQGHQVYLIFRHAGAAAVVLDPIWIDKDSVHRLPSILEDYFEIQRLKAPHKPQVRCLVGYSRPVGNFEMPTIYHWSGDDFVADDQSFPQFYHKLAEQNKDLLEGTNRGAYALYSEAVLLSRAGRKPEALKALSRVRFTKDDQKDLELVAAYHRLFAQLTKS